ncbi:MAG TPA: nitroreductase family protein [candidate division Zixibacteria bacterium]|nr:nitroreductase family protein [candidate division Zixibacteria bacterium]
MLKDLIRKCRSVRRFHGDKEITRDALMELVDIARLSPSAANLQPLKFIISADPERNEMIFKHLRWAGYLKDWQGPSQEERPVGYIIILGDKEISENVKWDHSIAAMSIVLGATEKGFGACIFASVDKEALREDLNIPERFDVLLAIAFGYSKEEVVLESVGKDGDIKYYRDSDGVHHVPKRTLEDIILEL